MSQPSPPDGSDPRVLAPSEDEEQVTVKAARGGSGKAFHTTQCRKVRQMRSTQEVSKSVAEWKGYHKCEVCITEGAYNDDPEPEAQLSTGEHTHPTPSAEECAAFRKRLVEGSTPARIASVVSWGRTAVYTHANGDCTHEVDVPHPPVTYDPEHSRHGWRVVESGEVDT